MWGGFGRIMCHKLDPIFFTRLAGMDPEDVCRRSLAVYDKDRRVYCITALGQEYEVNPERCGIHPLDTDEDSVSVELGLLIIFYLMQAKDILPEGRWVNEFSLKGGAMFFRGPHAFHTKAVAERFGRDVEGFKKVCAGLGGRPEQMGDAAFRFQILPRIQAVVVLWYADDEFEASAKLLMDATIEQHLPLDVIFGMALELLGRIVGENLWN